jgi:hypothetical protein
VSQLRQQFTVTWDDGDPVKVLTTVQDLITAVDLTATESSSNRIAMTTRLIYCALTREGHELPDYDEWLLLLDSYQETTAVTGIEGPTKPAPSEPELSSSPA